MGRFRKVDVRLWGDEKVRRLSRPGPNGRDCWLYLLTARESTALPGAIPAGAAALAETLKWPMEGFLEAFAEVYREGLAKADWDAGLVWIPKSIRYNPPESPNVVIAWARAFDELPDSWLKPEIFQAVERSLEAFGEGFREAFRKSFGKPSATLSPALPESVAVAVAGTDLETPMSAAADREFVEAQASLPLLPPKPAGDEATAEPVSSTSEQVRTVFEFWRKVMRKRPGELPTKLDAKRRGRIEARLRDGYTVEQLCQAVTGCSLTPHNMGFNDRGTPYNDLELICRDAPHVDRFMATAAKAAPPEPVEEKTDPCAVCCSPVGIIGRTRIGDAVLCVVCAQKLEHERDRPEGWRERAAFDAAWVAARRRSAA